MESLSNEALLLLLERAGVTPSAEDVERLKPVFQAYLERLRALHTADLAAEEVAGVFPPHWASA